MTSWVDTKAQLTQRQNDIATYVAGQMNQDITALNKSITSYIQSGGVSTGETNPDYDNINTLTQRLTLFKTQIIQLNTDAGSKQRYGSSSSEEWRPSEADRHCRVEETGIESGCRECQSARPGTPG